MSALANSSEPGDGARFERFPSQVDRAVRFGPILVGGLGTAVAMWAVGYVSRLPVLQIPAPLTAVAMLALLALGPALVGRRVTRAAFSGAAIGILATLVNLLILGSLLVGDDRSSFRAHALLWLILSFGFAALVGAIAARAAARSPLPPLPASHWNSRLAIVVAVATTMLIGIGGLVTSNEAGLAVPDWPNSFGSNMFLYPLSRMTGGIYYEHAHRLFGSLVGLSTLTFAIRLWITERRRWVRMLATAALLLVIAQGIMGGLRVTELSLTLAVLHGIVGQCFFGLVLALAAFCSPRWSTIEAGGSAFDRTLSTALIAMLIVQLALGAIVRHAGVPVWSHLIFAALVALVAMTAGVRAWGERSSPPPLPRLGVVLMTLTTLQLTLGFAAFAASGARAPGQAPTPSDVIFTTLHQTNGALLLGTAVLLMVWTRRALARGRAA